MKRAPVARQRLQSRGRAPSRNVTPLANNYTIRSSGTKPTLVTHTEYLDDVFCPQAQFKYEMNPGLTSTFTWLSQLAVLYDRYRVVAFTVNYVPAVAATHAGSLILAFDYDSDDPDPSGWLALENKTTKVVGTGRDRMSLALNPKMIHASNPTLYIRHENQTNVEKHTTDFGQLWVMATGDTAAVYGRLYMSYTIEFSAPNLEEPFVGHETLSGLTAYPGTGALGNYSTLGVQMRCLPYLDYLGNYQVSGHDRVGASFTSKWAPVMRVLRDFEGYVNVTTPKMQHNLRYTEGDTWPQDYTGSDDACWGVLQSRTGHTSGYASAGEDEFTAPLVGHQKATEEENSTSTYGYTRQAVKLFKGAAVVIGALMNKNVENVGSAASTWSTAGTLIIDMIPTFVSLLATDEMLALYARFNKSVATPTNATSVSSSSSSSPAVPVTSAVTKKRAPSPARDSKVTVLVMNDDH